MYVFLFFKINFGVCCSGFIINAYNKTVSFETVPKRENKQIPVKFMTSKHLGYRSRDQGDTKRNISPAAWVPNTCMYL